MDLNTITQDRRKLLGGVAAIALVALAGGALIGRSTAPSSAQTRTEAAAEAGEDGEDAHGEDSGAEGHGKEAVVEMSPIAEAASGGRKRGLWGRSGLVGVELRG